MARSMADFNLDVLLLFFNAVLTMFLAAGVVIWILRSEYLPIIRRMERQSQSDTPGDAANGAYNRDSDP